ncbi:hypothetical protein HY969_05095 [Candidatus Kaiserbacteria bacterium]|nr:hypothetical protein [Candidatus Kaiserbacteria bacterium]
MAITRRALVLLFVYVVLLLPYSVRADEGAVLSLLDSVVAMQQKVIQLLTSDTFFINPILKRVGIGTKEPVTMLDVQGTASADTAMVVRHAGPLGYRAMLVLSNKAVGQPEGSASAWTIAAGNAQTGVLGQRLGISGHSGNGDPNYKMMLDLSGNLELGNEAVPSGITLYDTVTKKPFCIRVTNGVLTPTARACQTK